jgi:hypothetical protein
MAVADHKAEQEAMAITREWDEQRSTWQRELDDEWQAICSNEPEAVLGVLAVAFEDNEAKAAAVGVDCDELSVAVLVPGVEMLPTRKPGVTAAGNISLKKFTKTESAALYKELVAGHLLTTVREALALAPGLQSVRATAVRRGAGGKVEALVAARFDRASLSSMPWHTASATEIVDSAQSELLVNPKGVTKALGPLDLRQQPGLQALVDTVAFEA